MGGVCRLDSPTAAYAPNYITCYSQSTYKCHGQRDDDDDDDDGDDDDDDEDNTELLH